MAITGIRGCRIKTGWSVKRWLILTVLLSLVAQIAVADDNKDDNRLKIAYLINFARFVYWPVAEPGATLHVCIISDHGYRDLVAELQPTIVQQRRVMMNVISASDDMLSSCHMVFISHGNQKDLKWIFDQLEGRAVLTIGEELDFISRGGMMRFYNENGKLRFAADPVRARTSGVQISAKLLDLARIESKPN